MNQCFLLYQHFDYWWTNASYCINTLITDEPMVLIVSTLWLLINQCFLLNQHFDYWWTNASYCIKTLITDEPMLPIVSTIDYWWTNSSYCIYPLITDEPILLIVLALWIPMDQCFLMCQHFDIMPKYWCTILVKCELTVYLIETPFNTFSYRADSGPTLFACGNMIKFYPTLVDLTSNFFVVQTWKFIYIIIHNGFETRIIFKKRYLASFQFWKFF